MTRTLRRTLLLLGMIALLPNTVVAATRVTIKPLQDFLIYPADSAPAQVISLNNAKISAQISAQISSFKVQAGDRVEKGATLVRLDCRDNRLLHDAAVARLSLAKKDAKRARSLQRSSNIAEQRYNQAVTEEIQAGINEKQTALQMQRCNITAPFSATVTTRLAAEGELAAPGTPLLQLIDSRQLEVSAKIPQDKIKLVESLDNLLFHYGETDYPVKIRRSVATIDPDSGNQEVRLVFSSSKALPGSSGRLTWKLTTPHIPPDLLSQRDGKVGIFLARDNKAFFHVLENAQIGHPAMTDLPASSKVIIEGRFGLKNGDPIEVTR